MSDLYQIRSHESPAVSVVIPSFNCAEYVALAINSILAQTLQNLEIIVVDDGSTDATHSAVLPYLGDSRVHYLHQPNAGVSAARNTGLRIARAAYVMFLDADDGLPPQALETMEAALERSGASWCVTDVWKVHAGALTLQRSDVPVENSFYRLLQDDFVRRGVFFRRDHLRTLGGYDNTLRTREDWDINIRMLENGFAYCYLAEPLYFYTCRDGSLTKSSLMQILADTERVLRKHHKRLADAGDLGAAKLYACNMWDLARRHMYLSREYCNAMRCAGESVRYDFRLGRVIHPLVHCYRNLVARPARACFRNDMK